jgi:hypothetical protein
MGRTDEITKAMLEAIVHGHAKTAKFWAAEFGVSVYSIYALAYRHLCRSAILSGHIATCSGIIPTQAIKTSHGMHGVRLGLKIMRCAGLERCEQVAYRVSDGEIVITKVEGV